MALLFDVESLRVWSPSQEVYLALLFVVESLRVWSPSQVVYLALCSLWGFGHQVRRCIWLSCLLLSL